MAGVALPVFGGSVTPAGPVFLTRSELAGIQTVQEAHRERPLIGDGAH
jgi:hypothetical protein